MASKERDRAQLGEQTDNDRDKRAANRSRDLSSEHRGQPVERETIGQRGKKERIDTTAGDEGIDEGDLSGNPQRDEREKEAHRMAGNQPGAFEQSGAVERDDNGSTRGEGNNRGEFSGQGGQKGGQFERKKEGTGYTSDRSGQLQEDDSQSGSQGRHGRSGSRQGASGNPRTGVSEQERTGGQTAQNPRESKR